MENRVFRLRVTYRMTGRLALLSHLEVTHALERIVRRAKLPFALSQGFSPHMKISFGGALPVGVGGEREIFDLQLTAYVAPTKVLSALQQASPGDLMPIECAYVEPKAAAASVTYPFSVYEATFGHAIETVAWPPEIEVVRKGKAKTLVVDDYLVGAPLVEGSRLVFQLESTQAGTLRPDVFLGACLPDDPAISIMRVSQSEHPIDLCQGR